jgi:hypothetical protein
MAGISGNGKKKNEAARHCGTKEEIAKMISVP